MGHVSNTLPAIPRPQSGKSPKRRDYVARRTAEGQSNREIMRCLKRYIARELYPHITAIDLHQPTQIAA